VLLRFRVRAVAGAAALCLWSAATVVAAGAGWRPPETIAPRAETQLLSSPLVALDGRGTAISTWGVLTASGWSGAIAERRARTGWTGSRALPHVPEALAVNERGDAVIAWIEPVSKGRRVALSWRRPAGGWQQAELVSPAGQEAAAPRVALDARGGALVVWAVRRGAADESLVVAAARSPRGSWTRPRTLAVGTEAEPAIAADGSALVVWSQACTDVAPAAKCTPLGAASEVAVATAASGDAVAVWRAHEGSGLGLGDTSLEAAAYAAGSGR
jgi:hypothetical protein